MYETSRLGGKILDITFDEIRKLTIISLFSDDELMDILVLKGGNALELAYELNSRASMDIDVSMEKDFAEFNLTVEEVEEKIKFQLNRTFSENNYQVFDIKLTEKPKKKKVVDDLNWGGYLIEFKVIHSDDYGRIGENNIEQLRRESLVVSEKSTKRVQIEISKYEFTKPSEEAELEDYIIKVYSPRMIIFEKLRAICQQMNEYTEAIRTSSTPRPRDFYDIYVIKGNLEPNLDLNSFENQALIKEFFKVKHVPLKLIGRIKDPEVREFHESAYSSLLDTVKASDELKPFEFYYNYVVELVNEIKPLWNHASSSLG